MHAHKLTNGAGQIARGASQFEHLRRIDRLDKSCAAQSIRAGLVDIPLEAQGAADTFVHTTSTRDRKVYGRLKH